MGSGIEKQISYSVVGSCRIIIGKQCQSCNMKEEVEMAQMT
jgi:hypothetical protein